MRAVTSTLPPAGYVTSSVIGLMGKSSAAPAAETATTLATATSNLLIQIFILSPLSTIKNGIINNSHNLGLKS
jgi:hypothetical protein